MAEERRAINAQTIDDATWQFAQYKPLQQWSPEQISNYADISPETIYQRIYADKRAGGLPWKQLRCQKQHKKRYGKNDHRGIIPNQQFIEQRPAIVETRSRIGDWEADTIIGKNRQQAIVSLVERKTGFALIEKFEHKTAQVLTDAMANHSNHTAHVHTRSLPTMSGNSPDTRSSVKTQYRVLLRPSLYVMGAWHQ